ncbi:MAG: hypothetical protein K2J88_03230 [Oscillospiraceae bacterium]|nr:hypothetical protein [Oscillospiraceae bacterium]
MKKLLYIAYSILFFIICAIPAVSMIFNSSEDSTSENRQLAEMPNFQDENGKFNQNWSAEFQAYVSDHFGFRKELVKADSTLKANLFHVSAEEDVIIGKDGWLYYTPTVNDYIGRATVSDLGLQNIMRNLELMQEYAESQGSKFYVTIVPNKNTVYPEYMPSNYKNYGTSNNLDNLENLLFASDLNYISLKNALTQEAQNSEVLIYHKQDTHWNHTGALLGYRSIMKAIGLNYNHYENANYNIIQNWQGDLQNMLFPDSDVLDDNSNYDIDFNYTYQGRYRDADDITINTINSNGTGSLLMFRDSFGEAIIPYFSQNFQMARYSRARPYPLYNLEMNHFDIVIMEIVERNISWIQKEAPMHSAIQVDSDSVPLSMVSFAPLTECYTDVNGSFLHIYGTIVGLFEEETTFAPEYIITLVSPSGDRISYKAYHCYESEKLGQNAIQDNGYSLYIPVSELRENVSYEAHMTIVFSDDNVLESSLGNITLP